MAQQHAPSHIMPVDNAVSSPDPSSNVSRDQERSTNDSPAQSSGPSFQDEYGRAHGDAQGRNHPSKETKTMAVKRKREDEDGQRAKDI